MSNIECRSEKREAHGCLPFGLNGQQLELAHQVEVAQKAIAIMQPYCNWHKHQKTLCCPWQHNEIYSSTTAPPVYVKPVLLVVVVDEGFSKLFFWHFASWFSTWSFWRRRETKSFITIFLLIALGLTLACYSHDVKMLTTVMTVMQQTADLALLLLYYWWLQFRLLRTIAFPCVVIFLLQWAGPTGYSHLP